MIYAMIYFLLSVDIIIMPQKGVIVSNSCCISAQQKMKMLV